MRLGIAVSITGVCLLLGGFSAAAGRQSVAGQKPKPSQTIQVDVDMVSLPVVVTDRNGRRVTDLAKEDFQVFEDGKLQTISGFATTDEPVDILLAIDTSGSVEQRLARMQNAAIEFVNLLHPDDEVAVMSFADDVMLLQDFSIDRRRNAVAIKETRVGDATSLYEAVWLALEQVLKPVPERNALVLFTDGVDTASRKASMKETLDLSRETRATIYSVYYNTERDLRRGSVGTTLPGTPPVILFPRPQVSGGGTGSTAEEYQRGRAYLADLSESSGGRVFDALRMEDLGGAFQGIAQELASQYSVGYYSTNPKHDGKFRKVEVKVSKPGLAVRTKKGYYARKDIEG